MKVRADEKLTFFESLCLFTLAFLSHIFSEVLPNVAKDNGPAAWICQLASGILALGFLGLFLLLYRRYEGMDLLEILDAVYGKVLSRVVMAALLVYLFFYAASMLNQAVETMQVYAYSNMSGLQIDLLLMAGVSVFALYSIKGLAKSFSFFVPLIFLTIVLIQVFSFRQYDPKLLHPVLGYGPAKIAEGSVYLTSKYNSVLLIAVFGGSFAGSKAYGRSAFWSVIAATALFTGATVCYSMVVPYSSAPDVQVGIIDLAQGSYNGRFLQRVESLYIAVSIMAILLLVGFGFLCIKKIYCHIFTIQKGHSRAVIAPLALLVICIDRVLGVDQQLQQTTRFAVRKYSIFLCAGVVVLTLLVSLIRRQGGGKLRRAAALCLVPVLSIGLFSGCGNYREPDSEIFPIIMGYDKGEKEKFRITMKFMTEAEGHEAQAATEQEDDSGEALPPDVMVFEAPTFTEGLNLINSLMPRHVSLLHIKMLVVSEEVAREGLDQIVSPLVRYNEIKPTMSFVVCKDSAYDFITSKNPSMTGPPQSDLELLMEIGDNSAYYMVTTLAEFLFGYQTTYGDAMAMYGGLSQSEYTQADKEEAEKESPADRLGHTPGSFDTGYQVGELPVMGNREMEIAGMAVFRGETMVGSLNTREAQIAALLSGEFLEMVMALPDPRSPEDYYVSIALRQVQPVRVETDIGEDGSTHMRIKVSVNGRVSASQNPDADYYGDPDQREQLIRYAQDTMRQRGLDLIHKLQKEYRSDALQLGRYAAKEFLTIPKWEEYDWLSQYPDADIDLEVVIYV